MLKVLFFARLRDQLGTESVSIAVTTPISAVSLKNELIEENPQWQHVLSADNILCAVNHEVVDAQHVINSGDEVAFFPPVTGG